MVALTRNILGRRSVERRVIDLAPQPLQRHVEPAAIGLSTIVLRDGSAVDVADIATAEQGRDILDEIDESILAIESQLALRQGAPEWRHKAGQALKVKKLQRPRVQERIGYLKRAAKAETHAGLSAVYAGTVDAKRGAFVKAAYALLGHERCADLWARAREIAPDAFDEGADA